MIDYDDIPREKALEQAKMEAAELAVAAGALRETVEIIEAEDVPLAYYPVSYTHLTLPTIYSV